MNRRRFRPDPAQPPWTPALGKLTALPGCALLIMLSLVNAAVIAADAPDLSFKPAQEDGFFSFDTGVLRGQLRANGTSQGIVELVHVASEVAVAAGGNLPGIFSYYRVFSTDARYGAAARDWPTINRVLQDGALELRWPPAAEHPVEIVAVFRWTRPDTLDLKTLVTPSQAMPRFEVFLSSYFMPGFRAYVYVKPNFFATGDPGFLPADVNPLVDGSYLMFPRDRQAVLSIFDQRWEKPPNPVQWSVTRWLAAPMALRRHEASGVTALIMAPPADCFALATPYNKTPPDGVAGHQSLYLSLFGQDVAAGQTIQARSRLVVRQGVSDTQAVTLFRSYLAEHE